MFNKLIIGILCILTSVGAYIGVASIAQLRAYDTVLVGYTSRINALQEQVYRLQEEDRELNVRLDQAHKRLTDQDNLIRIQNAQIAETRARIERKHK
jgi:peptidoglycan hydrolase CwlO-like protein